MVISIRLGLLGSFERGLIGVCCGVLITGLTQSASQKSCLGTNRSQGDLFFQGVCPARVPHQAEKCPANVLGHTNRAPPLDQGHDFVPGHVSAQLQFLSGDDFWEALLLAKALAVELETAGLATVAALAQVRRLRPGRLSAVVQDPQPAREPPG